MREFHYLRRLRSAGWPQRIGALGMTTRPTEAPESDSGLEMLESWHLLVGERSRDGGYHGRLSLCGNSPSDAQDALARVAPKRGALWLFLCPAVHHLTLIGLWELLEAGAWQLSPRRLGRYDPKLPDGSPPARKTPILSDPPTIVEASPIGVRGRIIFVDARNWQSFSPSLSTGSEELAKELWDYAVSLASALEAIDAPGLSPTIGSQAMRLYRARYLRSSVLIHSNERALALERASLWPARAECYQMGKIDGPLWMLDANALYSCVASSSRAPARLAGYSSRKDTDIRGLSSLGYSVLARYRVDTQEALYPTRLGKHCCYPLGRFETIGWEPHWQSAIDSGAMLDLIECAWYEPGELFTDIAARLYDARQLAKSLGDSAAAKLYKLLPNALFGKFAQHAYRWIDHPEGIATSANDCWYQMHPYASHMTRWRSIAYNQQFEDDLGESLESAPALTSWVCDSARYWLWRTMLFAGRAQVYYCDTDAVLASDAAMKKLSKFGFIGTLMGHLKIAGGPWSSVTVEALKHYSTEKDHVNAGVPKEAVLDSFGVWHWRSPERFAWRPGGDPLPKGRLVSYSARQPCSYQLGNVLPSGKVEPFILGGEDATRPDFTAEAQ